MKFLHSNYFKISKIKQNIVYLSTYVARFLLFLVFLAIIHNCGVVLNVFFVI